jgi:hypothetical protein
VARHRSENPVKARGKAESPPVSLSRREFFKGAGVTGLVAAASPMALHAGDDKAIGAQGTPEQIHLSWGDDRCETVFVSWASAGQAVNPRVHLRHASQEPRVIHAVQRTYTDGLNGQTVFTYHARLDALRPASAYQYSPAFVLWDAEGFPFAGRATAISRHRLLPGCSPRPRAAMRWRPWNASRRCFIC